MKIVEMLLDTYNGNRIEVMSRVKENVVQRKNSGKEENSFFGFVQDIFWQDGSNNGKLRVCFIYRACNVDRSSLSDGLI